MKNSFLMSALGAAILAGTAAQGIAQGMGMGMGDDMRGEGMRPSFEELDADADGKVTRAEMQRHGQARFEAADSDGDGKLSRAELEARMAARQAEMRTTMLDRMIAWRDADGDGSLSLVEMRGGHEGMMLEHADRDGDGAVSRAEFDMMKQRLGRHGDGGRRHKGMPDSD